MHWIYSRTLIKQTEHILPEVYNKTKYKMIKLKILLRGSYQRAN